MMWVSGSISAFIERHPTIKILALAFLILVGVVLIADAFHFDVPKGYLYFAMAFSVGVEMVNIRLRRLIDDAPEQERRERGRITVTRFDAPRLAVTPCTAVHTLRPLQKLRGAR